MISPPACHFRVSKPSPRPLSSRLHTPPSQRKRELRTKHPSIASKHPKRHELKNPADIKTAIFNLLNYFKSGGSFTTWGVYSEAPLPDLSLEGYGAIPLPLTQRDVEAICRERTGGRMVWIVRGYGLQCWLLRDDMDRNSSPGGEMPR